MDASETARKAGRGVLLGEFTRGYLINLPERTDRLRAATAEAARLGWPITIWPARRFAGAGGFESSGARGCFHSHLECLQDAAQRSESTLVLEDDVCFAPMLPEFCGALREQLQALPWDIVYFGHEQTGEIERASRESGKPLLRQHSGPVLTAHFYGVRASVVRRLVDFLELLLTREPGDPLGGPMTFDGALTTFRVQNPDIRTLIAVPKLGWQRSSRSDISPGRLDGFTALRPAVGIARRVKNLLARL